LLVKLTRQHTFSVMATINKALLDILVCPRCEESVRQQDETLVCQSRDCGLIYPIRNGIPILLIAEAAQPAPKA
jgi:uncharacterized protein YbaR (Trm112 family)